MIKCKDFTYKWVWSPKRIQGMENYGYYEVLYKDHSVNCGRQFTNKKAAQHYVSALVKQYNRTHKSQ